MRRPIYDARDFPLNNVPRISRTTKLNVAVIDQSAIGKHVISSAPAAVTVGE